MALRDRMTVREAHDDEFDAIVRTLAEAGFGTGVGRLLQYPRLSPAGTILVATGRRRVAGAAACASFGTTGWIGALGVAPRSRSKGVGSALTETAVQWLRERGAQTVLLYATEMGRPVYERVGFAAEGRARAWRGSPARPGTRTGPPGSLRPLRPDDRAAVTRLDRSATAEDRRAVISELTPLVGLAAEHEGTVRGVLLTSPWGAGPGILADERDAGLALLSAVGRTTAGSAIVTLPDANRRGTQALAAWGFHPVSHAERMRLGPPVPWSPERVFGMFNLFWG
jgi:GNAT superfamily N-acetyltransferase